jgi:transposase-like protein
MTTIPCTPCTQSPSGEGGHPALSQQVEGPFPGHHIYLCSHCGERWIRHYGSPAERFAWTRYSAQTPHAYAWAGLQLAARESTTPV